MNDDFADMQPKQEDPHWVMAKQLLKCLAETKKDSGMETELLFSMLQDLKVTPEAFEKAIFHAYCEWDL